MKLLDVVTANGAGPTTQVHSYGSRRYDLFTFYAFGTFDGATIQMQISLDQSEWFDVNGAALTAKGVLNVQFRAPYVRANVTGGGGSLSVTAELR